MRDVSRELSLVAPRGVTANQAPCVATTANEDEYDVGQREGGGTRQKTERMGRRSLRSTDH